MKERGEMVEERSVVSEDEKDEINHYNKKTQIITIDILQSFKESIKGDKESG